MFEFLTRQGHAVMKAIVIFLLVGAAAASARVGPEPVAAVEHGSVGPAVIPGETKEQKMFVIQDALKKMDVNGDHKVSEAEWLAAGGKKTGFDTLDYNRDGVLTVQELRSNARKLRAFQDFQAAPPH